MNITPLNLGFLCVLVGGSLTAYHLNHMLKREKNDNWYRITMILTGGLLISMSANLFATTIHDKLTHKP